MTAIHSCSAAMLCAALISGQAQAIVNVESTKIDRPTDGWNGTLGVQLNGAAGNTEKVFARVDALSIWQHLGHTELIQVQYAHGETRGRLDTQRAFVHIRHRTEMSSVLAWEGFVQTGEDKFARLAQRSLVGGGIRWTGFEEAQHTVLYLGLGAFKEWESLVVTGSTSDPRYLERIRGNSYLVYKHQLSPQAQFSNTGYLQPAFTDPGDYRLLNQLAFKFFIEDDFHLKINLDLTLDSRPPQAVKAYDLLYTAGFEFGF